MLTLTRPTEAAVIRYLMAQKQEPFSYSAQGVTRGSRTPDGFDRDHARIFLGFGRDVFQRAKQATAAWQMFDHAMTTLYWPDARIDPGSTVAVQLRAGPLWSLNPCRIVYKIEEPGRFGFAYGTLPGHIECGEESFVVERNQSDDSVWYEIRAVSRLSRLVTQLGYPIARWGQARFRRLSGEAMRQAITSEQPSPC